MGAPGGEPVEIEVKLGVLDAEALVAFLEDPEPEPLGGFAPTGPAHDVVVVDRYLDTAPAGGALEAAAVRARLRATGGSTVLTVKVEGPRRGAVHERLELEDPATADLDPDTWPDTPARRRLLAETGGRPLVVVAELRQDRRTRLLRRPDADVELSLDRAAAIGRGGGVAARRLELEAELVSGDAHALDELAAALRALPGIVDPFGAKWRWARAARDAETER